MTRVYRHYTQAELDAQFTLDTIADLPALFARRLQASARTRATLLHRRAVPYGPGPDETLDVFPAVGSRGSAPIQLFIHGGFWRSLDAATLSVVAEGFSPLGATTVIIDYPLIPTVRLGEIVDRCRAAVAWVYQHAADIGGDPDRIHVSGNSAGGHLVAMLMDRDWPPSLGLPADVIKGGTAISGLYDLAPVALSAENERLHLAPEEVAAWSPIRHLPRAAGPLLLPVGAEETPEFLDQTREFAAAWRGAGLSGEALVVAGANHVTVVLDGLADPRSTLNQAVRRQMGQMGSSGS
jgi:arylformamidase